MQIKKILFPTNFENLSLKIVEERDRCVHRFTRPLPYDVFGVHRYTAGLVPVYYSFTRDLFIILPKNAWDPFAEMLRLFQLPVPVSAARTVPVPRKPPSAPEG